MIKIKLKEARFGFDVDSIYDTIETENADGYVVRSGHLTSFVYKSDCVVVENKTTK